MEKLFIVIPAYNEELNIKHVVKDWHNVVENISKDSRLVVIDDGSKDGTYTELQNLKIQYNQLIVITKPNSGHGATLLYGYNYALDNDANYVFQTDSDGQTLANEFWSFWEARTTYDALIGYRHKRQDGLSRVFVTKVLMLSIFFIFHVYVKDANTPFRLMKSSLLKKYIPDIPKNYNLSNVLLTVLFTKHKETIKFLPITFRPRQGGENSINFLKIIGIGKKAIRDFEKIKGEIDNESK